MCDINVGKERLGVEGRERRRGSGRKLRSEK